MCVAVYVASSRSLPLVVWNEAAPSFYVEPAALDDVVRAHLLGSEVFYLGSHEGCGCGFRLDGQKGDDWEQRLASLRSMIDYVARASSTAAVQVWIGWEGDQAKAADSTFELSPSRLRDPEVWTPLLATAYKTSHVLTVPAGTPDIVESR